VVIGAGRVGSSLALALRSVGAHLAGFTARTVEGRSRAEAWLEVKASMGMRELVARSPHIYAIAVPDDVLPEVARELADEFDRVAGMAPQAEGQAAPLVLHTSGATSVAVLAPCARAGALTLAFHPLQTFPDPIAGAARFAGAAIAVTPGGEDPDPRAAELGFSLARSLGARPFLLADGKRTLYHAAATMACNYFVTLEHQAEQMFIKAGLGANMGIEPNADRDTGSGGQETLALFLPLVAATLENLRSEGSLAALTGPLSRGDEHTVDGHLKALAAEAPDLLPLYRILGLATLDIVRARGEVDDGAMAGLARLLDPGAQISGQLSDHQRHDPRA